MRVQKHLSEKDKERCEDIAMKCLNEIDEKYGTLDIINRYLLLLHKNLGVYKMTAFSELVHVFNRVLDMAECGEDSNGDIFWLSAEANYIKWEDDLINDSYDKWKGADYATLWVTAKFDDEKDMAAFDETLKNVIELFRSCIDITDYEEGDVEYWRKEFVLDEDGEIISEQFDDETDELGNKVTLSVNEEAGERKSFETTFHYSFYSHDWIKKEF
jgi:hypothetical protein